MRPLDRALLLAFWMNPEWTARIVAARVEAERRRAVLATLFDEFKE